MRILFAGIFSLVTTYVSAACIGGMDIDAVAIKDPQAPLASLWAAGSCRVIGADEVTVATFDSRAVAKDVYLDQSGQPTWLSVTTIDQNADLWIDLRSDPALRSQVENGETFISAFGPFSADSMLVERGEEERLISEQNLVRYSTSYASAAIALAPFDDMVAIRFVSTPSGASISLGSQSEGETEAELWIRSRLIPHIALELNGQRCTFSEGKFTRSNREDRPSIFECVLK